MSRLSGVLTGSATWDPGNIIDGNEAVTTVTVAGAKLGDFVPFVSFSLDVADLSLTAFVTAANTVTAQLGNDTGDAVNLGSGTLRVGVVPARIVDPDWS